MTSVAKSDHPVFLHELKEALSQLGEGAVHASLLSTHLTRALLTQGYPGASRRSIDRTRLRWKEVAVNEEAMLSDTDDQTMAAEAGVPAEATEPASVPQTATSPRRDSWFRNGLRNGIIAAVVVVVAGAFFTIGWFTSTRGDHGRSVERAGIEQRMNLPQSGVPQGGTDQQGSNQAQGHRGRNWGMNAPQQGQAQGQAIPRGQSQSNGPSTQQPPSTQQAPSVQQGYLGVGLETVTAALQKQYDLSSSSGALVTALDDSGPAVQAGIRQGDVITAIDGATVTQQQDVVSVVTQKKAGDSVSVSIDRNGQSLTIQVTLASRLASVSG